MLNIITWTVIGVALVLSVAALIKARGGADEAGGITAGPVGADYRGRTHRQDGQCAGSRNI